MPHHRIKSGYQAVLSQAPPSAARPASPQETTSPLTTPDTGQLILTTFCGRKDVALSYLDGNETLHYIATTGTAGNFCYNFIPGVAVPQGVQLACANRQQNEGFCQVSGFLLNRSTAATALSMRARQAAASARLPSPGRGVAGTIITGSLVFSNQNSEEVLTIPTSSQGTSRFFLTTFCADNIMSLHSNTVSEIGFVDQSGCYNFAPGIFIQGGDVLVCSTSIPEDNACQVSGVLLNR